MRRRGRRVVEAHGVEACGVEARGVEGGGVEGGRLEGGGAVGGGVEGDVEGDVEGGVEGGGDGGGGDRGGGCDVEATCARITRAFRKKGSAAGARVSRGPISPRCGAGAWDARTRGSAQT